MRTTASTRRAALVGIALAVTLAVACASETPTAATETASTPAPTSATEETSAGTQVVAVPVSRSAADITPEDLGPPDWNDEIDLTITWDGDLATIRRVIGCGDECANVYTLVLRDEPSEELPTFVRFEHRRADFEFNETERIDAGRLEISEWSPVTGSLSGRFFDEEGSERLVFWFGGLAAASASDSISDDLLQAALTSDDPTVRTDALQLLAREPDGRDHLLDSVLGLLGDTAPIASAQSTDGWAFWPTDANRTHQVVGEHAAAAANAIANGPNAADLSVLLPTDAWLAIDWVPNPATGDAAAQVRRIRQVTENWITAAEANKVTDLSVDPAARRLAGLYYYATDSCEPEGDGTNCISIVHLLCNGMALWNVDDTIAAGPWTVGTDTLTLAPDVGPALTFELGPENEWPPLDRLSRHLFNGLQCQ